jgi:NitT/TauT family transport system permease protein
VSILDRVRRIFVRHERDAGAERAAASPERGDAATAPTGEPADTRRPGRGDAKLAPPPAAPVLAEPFFGLFRIRGTVRRRTAILLGAVPLVLLLLLWWLVTAGDEAESRVISPVILPSPGEVVESFRSLWFDRALMRSILTSLARVAGGFLAAAVVALPLGIAMGAFTKIKSVFNPLSVMGSYLPIAAIVPLTLSWFGTGELQKVMFLAIASFVVLLPLVVKAIDAVDPVYLNTAYTLGANRKQTVTKVLLGVALPDVFDAIRLTFGVGWTYIILAEIVDAERGLGSLIIASQRRGPREHIYLVLAIIMVLAFVIDQAFFRASKALFPYRYDWR